MRQDRQKEGQAAKREQRARNKAQRPTSVGGEDPDIAGIMPQVRGPIAGATSRDALRADVQRARPTAVSPELPSKVAGGAPWRRSRLCQCVDSARSTARGSHGRHYVPCGSFGVDPTAGVGSGRRRRVQQRRWVGELRRWRAWAGRVVAAERTPVRSAILMAGAGVAAVAASGGTVAAMCPAGAKCDVVCSSGTTTTVAGKVYGPRRARSPSTGSRCSSLARR